VSGIEGTFRITCENVMRVIRENKESLMAVLEAFVYDPLINWRLLNTASPKQEGGKPPRPGKTSLLIYKKTLAKQEGHLESKKMKMS
jgi:phosphatidylinositol kinase/protein kinase (PI-3  family)